MIAKPNIIKQRASHINQTPLILGKPPTPKKNQNKTEGNLFELMVCVCAVTQDMLTSCSGDTGAP